LLLVGLVTLAPVAACAQGMTGELAEAILQELRAIRQLLQRGAGTTPGPATPAAAPARFERVTIADEPAWALGRPDAPVTLVEFTDLECPFCRRFHVSTFEELRNQYIDTGKVRFVSRDLPLEIHKHALLAAHAARCAGEQGKFWELRHTMLVNGRSLGPETIRAQAGDLGLDVAALESCIDSRRHEPAIQKDMSAAQAAGLTGTPSFVLGKTTVNGIEGIKIVGAQPYATFEGKIRELLAAP
jgi:protein-disulfide isomerase